MKTGLTIATVVIALVSFATLAHAEDCARVEVQNLRTGQGPLMIAAYGAVVDFDKAPASRQQVAVTAETMRIELCGLAGRPAAAFTLFQDLNANGKLDTNPFGIPTEPWGASGKSLAMSAPTWQSAQVPLDGSVVVVKLSK